MTGRALTKARDELGLSRAELAAVLGVSHVTVFRWEVESSPISALNSRLLAMVVGLSEHEDSARYGRALRQAAKDDPLYALHLLLCMGFGEWAPRAKKGTK